MIKIEHEVRTIDGKQIRNELTVSKRGQLSGISFTIHEAHEHHTALGEKLKEINENNN